MSGLNIWKAVKDEMPAADETVLIHCPEADEPVWLGFFDGEAWRDVNAEPLTVTHWAIMPEGPGVEGAAALVREADGYSKIGDDSIDGWFWSPDCGMIQRKAGKFYYANGEVSDKAAWCRVGFNFYDEKPDHVEDMSLWTDEKRAAIKAKIKSDYEEQKRAAAAAEEVRQIHLATARAKLTEEEFEAVREEGGY